MTTANIIVTVYTATRPGKTPHAPGESTVFAGVSESSTRPEGPGVWRQIKKDGWSLFAECTQQEAPYRKLVRVELPEGVQEGPFSFAHRSMTGLHSAHSTKDGMGPCVFVWCNTPAQVREHNLEAAVDEAIASGLTFSVPQADGGRKDIPAKVIAVSDFYGSATPANWQCTKAPDISTGDLPGKR